METITPLIEGVANLGFPIVLSWYLLSRMETKLDKLVDSIDQLSNLIASKA